MNRTLFALVFLIGFSLNSKAANVSIGPSPAVSMDACEPGTKTALKVVISNMSPSVVLGPFEVTYSINGGPVQSYLWGIPSMSGSAVYTYTYPDSIDISPCQVHTIECHINITGDTDLSNNSATYTVYSDCPPTAGTITAPTTVCQNLNSGNLEINGYTGTIKEWIYSTDGGTNWTAAGTSATQPYSNINGPMEWAVVLNSPFGICDDDTTAAVHIDVVPQTIAGNLPLDFDICENGNDGELNLTGYLGTILGWEFSQDGGTTWTPIANSSDEQTYLDLTVTTLYHVQVKNDICPAVFTAPVTLTLVPGSDAGSIVGEAVVCNFENDSSLQANPVNGNVIGWNVSSDGGSTWFPTTVTGSVYPYANLNTSTLFASLVQAGTCPIDTAYHLLVVLPLGPSAGPDVTITEGDSTMLSATGGSFFNWSPNEHISDPTIYNPTVWPLITTEYFVTVTDVNGCSDTASVTITVKPDMLTLNIPNMLTPNGDGYNDILVIENIDSYPKNEILIFNTYGQVIFRSSPYNNDWTASFQGSNVPDGTYFYVLDLNDEALVQNEYQGIITVVGQAKP